MQDPQKNFNHLEAIIGTWKSSGKTIADKDNPSVIISGTDAYEWLPGKKFIIHRVDVKMGKTPVNAIEIIGGYDKSHQAFDMHAFQNDGTQGLMKAKMKKSNVWEFSGENIRATLTIHKNGQTMDALWERLVGSEWVHWMDMHFTKSVD